MNTSVIGTSMSVRPPLSGRAARGDMVKTKSSFRLRHLLKAQDETDADCSASKSCNWTRRSTTCCKASACSVRRMKVVLLNQHYVDLISIAGQRIRLGMSLSRFVPRRRQRNRSCSPAIPTLSPTKCSPAYARGVRSSRSGYPQTSSALRCVNQPMPNGGWVATLRRYYRAAEIRKGAGAARRVSGPRSSTTCR